MRPITRKAMRKLLPFALTGILVLLPAASRAVPSDTKSGTNNVISRGQTINLVEHRTPEQPTVFVFVKSTSTLEQAFLAQVRRDAGDKVGVGIIELKTGMEPIAARYQITETPTALVYDRRGRLVGRSAEAEAIRALISKAAGVMRIDWAAEGDANFQESARVLGRSPGSGILRTMTLQPEYLKYINDLSQKAHFSDGFLKRRIKEMIATYVSQLNRCKY